jgi:hypothetical protein
MKWLLPLLTLASMALAACNGHDALCSRRYSNITYMGAHNSAFDGFTPFHNQFVSVTTQLDLGVRFLQAQTQEKKGHPQMCHSHCWALDEGPLEDYLSKISDWLDENPDEVVTLLLTNIDALPIEKFDDAFKKTGLRDYAFKPEKRPTKDDWPTLQEIIDLGTRLIVFMDYNMDEKKVPYIMDQFKHWWETPFGITDASFPTCEVDRPNKGDPKKLMGIMNHMLNYKVLGVTFPNMDSAIKTNSAKSIDAQVKRCVDQHKMRPNVVLLDWINIGQGFQVAKTMNGL